MPNNKHIQHPVIHDCLSLVRDKNCSTPDFRRYIMKISSLMVPYISANLETQEVQITTPLKKTMGQKIKHPIVLVPILRAGLGMLEGFLKLLPNASVAHIGMARNEETLQPQTYYFNTPLNLDQSDMIMLDPMLATGGSASAAISEFKKKGARRIRFACILCSPQGLEKINTEHPDVELSYVALDETINEKGYILPGLGDAGDRIFGTTNDC